VSTCSDTIGMDFLYHTNTGFGFGSGYSGWTDIGLSFGSAMDCMIMAYIFWMMAEVDTVGSDSADTDSDSVDY